MEQPNTTTVSTADRRAAPLEKLRVNGLAHHFSFYILNPDFSTDPSAHTPFYSLTRCIFLSPTYIVLWFYKYWKIQPPRCCKWGARCTVKHQLWLFSLSSLQALWSNLCLVLKCNLYLDNLNWIRKTACRGKCTQNTLWFGLAPTAIRLQPQ